MGNGTVQLNDVFSQHYHDLVAWCRARVRNDLGDPEDFVHLAYVRCSRRWSAERKSKNNEVAYLYRALRWVILDALRKHCREASRTWALPQRINGRPWASLRSLAAKDALGLLKGRQREVCQAMLEGKSNVEIRRDLQLSAGALAVHVCRARATLCRYLEVCRDRRKRSRDARGPSSRRGRPSQVSQRPS